MEYALEVFDDNPKKIILGVGVLFVIVMIVSSLCGALQAAQWSC